MWVKQPNFFGTQKQSNIGQFTYDKKMKTYNLGKLTYMYFFLGGGDICEAMATDQPDTTSTVRTSTSYRSTAL